MLSQQVGEVLVDSRHRRPGPCHTSPTLQGNRKKLVAPPSGVCLLRVGILRTCEGATDGAITLDKRRAERMVDVLAMQEAALRHVRFLGEPLGAAGAAVALRQAKKLRLDLPQNTSFHGRVCRLFIRADVIERYIASSPTLAQLLTTCV